MTNAPPATPGPPASAAARALLEENEHLKAMYSATKERAEQAERELEQRGRADRGPMHRMGAKAQGIEWTIARFIAKA